MVDKIYDISGMSCSACSAAVQRAVDKLPGIENASVNLLTGSLSISYSEKLLTHEEIVKAVENAGYKAALHEERETVEKKQVKLKRANKKLKLRLILSVVFLLLLMLISMGPMVGLHIIPEHNTILKGIVELSLLSPILALNFKYFTSGFKALLRLNPNMDSLIAIGALASVLYSLWLLFAGGAHHYYFESAGMILTFITIGKYFESKSKAKTTDAVNKLINLAPKKSIILKDGAETEIDSENIVIGDVVVMKAGMVFPADGKVISGNGTADESAITGESIPTEKCEGDTVTGGTLLSGGYLHFRAERVGKDTTLSGIIKLVEEATLSKPNIAKIADKISRIFVPAVILIAILTGLIWYFISFDFEIALRFSISVLVISCPCALGLATPTAIMVGTGRAAELGILVKSADIFEIGSEVKTVVFDKTGTITTGKPQVTAFITDRQNEEMKILKDCAALEALSDHPLASAVVSYSNIQEFQKVSDFENVIGKGVKGVIGGYRYTIGNAAFTKEFHISEELKSKAETRLSLGETLLYVARENEIIALISIADRIKDSAADSIRELNAQNIKTIMLTGDNEKTAENIKSRVGITEAKAELLPADKNRIIKEYQNDGAVVMVGDGINDSPALAAADIGIALGAGTDIAMESADVILLGDSLKDVNTTLHICRKVMKNIKENLFWALIYNALCIPLAAGVLSHTPLRIELSPMIGTIAMSLSSICVVSNALRLRRIKKQDIKSERKEIPMKTVYIEGMMCPHCEARVKTLLSALDTNVTVDFKTGTAVIKASVDNQKITDTVADAGYKVTRIE